jgi:hypothetical protein
VKSGDKETHGPMKMRKGGKHVHPVRTNEILLAQGNIRTIENKMVL